MPFKKVNSLSRGLMILESFTSDTIRLSLAEISKITDTPKATAYRLLKTLTELNYLKYDSRYKEYYLGPKVLSLGYSVLRSLEIQEIIRPYLGSLSKECEKTVSFAILDDTEMVYIDRIRAPDIVYMDVTIGARIPLYNTSVGKVVMANLEKKNLLDILEKLKSDSNSGPYISNRKRLFSTLEEIRTKGYATATEEYRKGVRAIAVPVLGSEGIVGGINLVVAKDLVSMDEVINKYSALMIETSREISEALGYLETKKASLR